MWNRQQLVDKFGQIAKLTPETIRVLQGSKKYGHPNTTEILTLLFERATRSLEELRPKYDALKAKLEKIAQNPKPKYAFAEYTHIDACRGLAVLAEEFGDLGTAKVSTEKVRSYFSYNGSLMLSFADHSSGCQVLTRGARICSSRNKLELW